MLKFVAEGRITKDATVFEYGNEGKTAVGITLACNGPYQGADVDPSVSYVNVTFWNRGESFAAVLTQGQQLFVIGDGEMRTREVDGEVFHNLVITRVEDFSFGAKPRRRQQDTSEAFNG